MAPIQLLFTSAIVLSAAVAAPINTNYVGTWNAGASAPSRHQSEPMRAADPVMSSVPMMSIDTQAPKSSAAAMAVQTPPSTSTGQQSDVVFGVLNKLPVKREEEDMARRQLKELTSLLTSINSIPKRDDELEERQLGLIKSVPEAVSQAAQVEKLVASLPIKRDGSGILGGLGGLGGVLGGSVKRDVKGEEAHDETYTEKALKGFEGWMHHDSKDKQETPEIPSAADSLGLDNIAQRADPVTGLVNGPLAKRDAEGAEAESHDETYTEKALKGFQGWIHHGVKDNKQETPELPSAADSIGLADVVKRGSPTDPITDVLGLLAKRDYMESDEAAIDALAKRDIDDAIATASGTLDNLAKRKGIDSVDALIKGLTKGGQLNNGLNIRQLNVLSSLATGALSNAGTAASGLGKVAAGKHRRGNGDAGSVAAAATAGMNVGNHHEFGSDDDDESADVDDFAADVAEGEQTLQDATSPKGDGGHLDKRQVPPIAGSDALSIVKGLVANPSAALTPVTKGVLLGGTALGDMAPQ